jgi:hypothetical protein
MYSDKHMVRDHLVLTEKAKENISNLINHREIKKVSISGEGEPLNNIKALKEILSLSKGGIAFEFITSGYISNDKLLKLYYDINKLITKNGDTCNIRLSTDSYHISKINNKPHAISIKYLLDNNLTNITVSFRSIDIDKKFTRDYLKKEFALLGMQSNLIVIDTLEDNIVVNNKKFQIDYRNLVKPTFLKNTKYMTLAEYVEAKEQKLNKIFTLGNINKKPSSNGLGITIKPNGDVYFYGIDNNKLANIHIDDLDIEFFKEIVKNDRLVNTLYTKPFMNLMDKISINDDIKQLIRNANNPYWVIKEIMHYDKFLLNKMIEND